jgi:hypothetical protein
MLRTKGEAGTGNVVEAVRHARAVQRDIRRVASMDEDELYVFAKEIRVGGVGLEWLIGGLSGWVVGWLLRVIPPDPRSRPPHHASS